MSKRLLALLLFLICFAVPLEAQTPLRLGVLGDSRTDEYRGTDNRGGVYASVTFNWLELLVRFRGVDAGAWSANAEPRRVGYAANWARTAATTATMLSAEQHTGLAEQVDAGAIDAVIIMIGSNDFAPYNGNYGAIYSGAISGAALDNKISGIVAAIQQAIITVRRARPIPLTVATISDWNMSPAVLNNPAFSDPTRRQRVSDAIAQTNTLLRAALVLYPDVAVFDVDAFAVSLLARLDGGALVIGGERINVLSSGDEPHNGILGDSIHAGTVMGGLLANGLIGALNTVSAQPVEPLTDAELLTAAGITPVPPTILPPSATWYPPPSLTPSVTPSAAAKPTVTITPSPTDTPAPTLDWTTISTIQIRSGADDVNEDGSSFTAGSAAVWIGNGQAASWTGLRFTGVTIPAGATIVSARVDVYVPQDVWIQLSFQLAGEAADDSAPFSSASRPSARALTAARVNHTSSVKWLANTWYSLGDITPVVREILTRPGWHGGNALALIVRGTGGAWARKYVRAFESGVPARLVITYR